MSQSDEAMKDDMELKEPSETFLLELAEYRKSYWYWNTNKKLEKQYRRIMYAVSYWCMMWLFISTVVSSGLVWMTEDTLIGLISLLCFYLIVRWANLLIMGPWLRQQKRDLHYNIEKTKQNIVRSKLNFIALKYSHDNPN